MLHSIFKYTLTSRFQTCSLDMPAGARVLSVQTQKTREVREGESLQLWALVNLDAPMVKRTFKVIATGEEFDMSSWDGYSYVGTCQMLNGSLVFHVLEILTES